MIPEEVVVNVDDHMIYSFDIPEKPEHIVYLLLKDNRVVYVGQSQNNFMSRVNEHLKNKDFTRVFAFNVGGMRWSLEEVEHAFISFYQPKLNVSGRNDVKTKDFLIMSYFFMNYDWGSKNNGV